MLVYKYNTEFTYIKGAWRAFFVTFVIGDWFFQLRITK